jgi:hypothetical protein
MNNLNLPDKPKAPTTVGSGDLLDLMEKLMLVVVCLMLPMLIMLLIMMALSIKEKCRQLNEIPEHRQNQANPHGSNTSLVIPDKLWCFCGRPLSSVTHTLNLEARCAESLDGFISKANCPQNGDCDSDSGDVFGTHSAMRPNVES